MKLNQWLYTLPFCLLCIFLISLHFGCGEDNAEDTSQNLVGTWELIEIDAQTPKTYFQHASAGEAVEGFKTTEILNVAYQLVLSSNETYFSEMSFTMRGLVDDSVTPIYVKMDMQMTDQGRYVVLDSVIEFTPSADSLNFGIDASWEVPEHPEREQELDQALNWEDYLEEYRNEPIGEIALELSSSTFDLEGNLLTLEGNLLTLDENMHSMKFEK